MQVPISELMGTVDEETFMIKNEPSASPTDTVNSEDTPSGECMPYHPLESAESPEGDRRAEEQDDGALESLPYGKLNKLYHNTKTFVKRVDDDINKVLDLRDYEAQKPYVLWEVYAGEGRITRTANRRDNLKGERFSREDGWDFDKAAHRRAFLRRLREEKPDAVMWSPVCTLWSNLQELANATNPARQATLETRRLEDHATHHDVCRDGL